VGQKMAVAKKTKDKNGKKKSKLFSLEKLFFVLKKINISKKDQIRPKMRQFFLISAELSIII